MRDGQDSFEARCAAHAPLEVVGHFTAGTVFGDWRVTALIGRGGNGEVYCAEHVTLRTPAAVKVLTREEERARTRFEREARLLAQLKSNAFPQFYAYGEANGTTYLAMELLEPGDLPTDDKSVARFLLNVCTAVAELHTLGLVHRDIKPGNILWRTIGSRVPSDHGRAGRASRPRREPVLADLGLVKDINHQNVPPSNEQATLGGVGTPGYGAPEQMECGEVSCAADIHALGVLADRCFGGKPSRAWARIIQCATSSIPAHRYPSVATFARAIRWRHLTGYLLGLMVSLFVLIAVLKVGCGYVNILLEEPRVATMPDARTHAQKVGEQLRKNSQEPGKKDDLKMLEARREREKNEERKRQELVARQQQEKELRDKEIQRQNQECQKAMERERKEAIRRAMARMQRISDPTNMPVVSIRRLEGNTVVLSEPIVLEGGKEYQIYGPGTLDADLFCPTTAIVRLKNCVLLNRTKRLYPENAIQYRLENGVYLNFINVRKKPVELSVWDFTRNYDGAYNVVRFGGPETLKELMRLREEEGNRELRTIQGPQHEHQNNLW